MGRADPLQSRHRDAHCIPQHSVCRGETVHQVSVCSSISDPASCQLQAAKTKRWVYLSSWSPEPACCNNVWHGKEKKTLICQKKWCHLVWELLSHSLNHWLSTWERTRSALRTQVKAIQPGYASLRPHLRADHQWGRSSFWRSLLGEAFPFKPRIFWSG